MHISCALLNAGSPPASGWTPGNFYDYKSAEHTSLYVPEYAMTNNGYGPAYFFKGLINYNVSNSAMIANSGTYFALDAWNYNGAGNSRYAGVFCTTFNPSEMTQDKNKINAITRCAHGSADEANRLEDLKKWCCEPLSDAYNQRINMVDSTVDVIEFLDEGDVTLEFMRIKNGLHEEGSTSPYYGAVSDEDCTTLLQDGSVAKFIYKPVSGTENTIIDLKTCSNKTWLNWTHNVSVGDKIQFIAKSSYDLDFTGGYQPAGHWSNNINYAIIFFTNQIAGWKKAD